MRRGERENCGRDKIIVENYIGLLDGTKSFEGEKLRISGASTDQGYVSALCRALAGKRCASQLARRAGI
jgi:hypothetical protein